MLRRLGLDRPAQLREVPVAHLLGAQRVLAAAGDPFTAGPVVDGAVLPEHPLDAACDGQTEPVPLLIGTTKDEVRFFYVGAPILMELTEKALRTRLSAAIGAGRARQVIGIYRERAPDSCVSPGDLLVRLETDRTLRAPAMAFAGGHAGQTLAYRFDFAAAPPEHGACHAVDLPFVFGRGDVPSMRGWIEWTPEALELRHFVRGAWIDWIYGECPNVPGAGPWPDYQSQGRSTMIFDVPSRVQDAPDEPERAAWLREELYV